MTKITGTKMSEITANTVVDRNSKILVYNPTKNRTELVSITDAYKYMIEPSAAAHNGIYRGKDITDLFYDGTLSKQIAAGTFDDIFVGDYIRGNRYNETYLVADLDYRYGMGDRECTTHHVLMISDRVMMMAMMNSTDMTEGAYVGSEIYKTNLAGAKSIIQEDFGTSHILTHRNHLQNAVSNGYESGGTWYDSTIELMNEHMVFGSNIFHNVANGTNIPNNYEIDNSQLALFRLDCNKIIAKDASGNECLWWLRNACSQYDFACVFETGVCGEINTSAENVGVRPAFLII